MDSSQPRPTDAASGILRVPDEAGQPSAERAVGLTAGKHRPPSRLRYAAAHPTIGVHVDMATYDRLLALRERTGASFAQLVLRALGEVELEVDTAVAEGRSEGHRAGHTAGLDEGYGAGYAAAVEQFRLVAFCARCWNGIVIEAGSQLGELAVGLLNAQGPHHDSCQQVWEVSRRQPGR